MPSFRRMPAKSIEPAVGASVCASGSHVWKGKDGTFTANAMAMPKNNQRPVLVAKLSEAMILVKSNDTPPLSPAPATTARVTMETSMNAEPSIV